MLSTDQKGNIAEAAVALSAAKLGFDVYRPITEGGRYDLIIDSGERLLRVQCKWAPLQGETVLLRCYTSRRNCDGIVRRPYGTGEVDAYAAYCSDLDRCYFVPFDAFAGRVQVMLRLSPTRNNQHLGVNWARDFEFEAKLGGSGAVAQLGERRHGMAEARGSIPLGSTLRDGAAR